MNQKEMESELSSINDQRLDLQESLRQCKERRDRVLEKKIRSDLKVLSNRAKHLLFKMGKYQYPEEEYVEYQPGEVMDANVYHWLKD